MLQRQNNMHAQYSTVSSHLSKKTTTKTLVYCAFSGLFNNWAITENAVKHICVVRAQSQYADLNLACSTQFGPGLEFHITAV